MSNARQPTTGRTIKLEGVVQVVIMLAIGGAAGAASFTHVHNVAEAHGQGGWLAWADAVVLELMSLASGLELRHRNRHGKPVGMPVTVLVLAVVLSLSAQVVEAEPSVIGWIAAALPAAGFLAMVKIALGHSIPQTQGIADGSPASDDAAVPVDGQERSPDERTDGNHRADEPRRAAKRPAGRTHRTGTVDGPDAGRTDWTALETAAGAVHAALADEGMPLTRDALAARLRDAGYTVSNAHASDLVKLLRSDSFAVNDSSPATTEQAN